MIEADIFTFKDPFRHKQNAKFHNIQELEETLMIVHLAGELVGVIARDTDTGDIVYERWDNKAKSKWAKGIT